MNCSDDNVTQPCHHASALASKSIPAADILLQREPMMMIDALTEYRDKQVTTQTTVHADGLFIESGHLTAEGMMENVAQTCAARIGYENKYILHKPLRIGYIAAIRCLKVMRLPLVGEALTTTVTTTADVFGMMMGHARVCSGGELCLETDITMAIKE